MSTLSKSIATFFAIIVIISCKTPVAEINHSCDIKPSSLIWGEWKELSFQKKFLGNKDFEKEWTISTKQNNLTINACTDVTAEQRKNIDCCQFLYYTLKNDTLFAGGFGGGKGCENIYCLFINGQLIIEKLSADSLTLINDFGRSKYLKIK